MQKNVTFTRGYLCSSFVEGETKESFGFSNVFFAYVISPKRIENQRGKNTQKRFPINLSLTYQKLGRICPGPFKGMPKIKQI